MNFDPLKLENQLCFPLYAASKEIIRKYKPFLDEIDLTYTQYIVMLVLWERDNINVKSLGDKLFLDSGTLTPLLLKLEKKGYIVRKKSSADERNVIVMITDQGKKLRDVALSIPEKVGKCLSLEKEEALFLDQILYKILSSLSENDTI